MSCFKSFKKNKNSYTVNNPYSLNRNAGSYNVHSRWSVYGEEGKETDEKGEVRTVIQNGHGTVEEPIPEKLKSEQNKGVDCSSISSGSEELVGQEDATLPRRGSHHSSNSSTASSQHEVSVKDRDEQQDNLSTHSQPDHNVTNTATTTTTTTIITTTEAVEQPELDTISHHSRQSDNSSHSRENSRSPSRNSSHQSSRRSSHSSAVVEQETTVVQSSIDTHKEDETVITELDNNDHEHDVITDVELDGVDVEVSDQEHHVHGEQEISYQESDDIVVEQQHQNLDVEEEQKQLFKNVMKEISVKENMVEHDVDNQNDVSGDEAAHISTEQHENWQNESHAEEVTTETSTYIPESTNSYYVETTSTTVGVNTAEDSTDPSMIY